MDGKNLNNTQRKMLERIYVKRIQEKQTQYERERINGRNDALQEEVAKIEKQFKPLMDAARKYWKLYEEQKDDLRKAGVRLDFQVGMARLIPEYSYYGAEKPQYLKKYDEETSAALRRLNEIRDEVTLRIYGSDATYADIDKEINELLKGVIA